MTLPGEAPACPATRAVVPQLTRKLREMDHPIPKGRVAQHRPEFLVESLASQDHGCIGVYRRFVKRQVLANEMIPIRQVVNRENDQLGAVLDCCIGQRPQREIYSQVSHVPAQFPQCQFGKQAGQDIGIPLGRCADASGPVGFLALESRSISSRMAAATICEA